MDFLLQWLIPEGISHDHDLNHLNSFWKIWSDSCRTNISFFLAFRVLIPLDGWNLSNPWWNSAYLSRKWCRWPRSIGKLSQATFPHFYSSVYISLSHFSYLQFELCRCTHHLWTNFKISTEPGPAAAAPHIFTGNLIETQRWRHQQHRKPPKHGTAFKKAPAAAEKQVGRLMLLMYKLYNMIQPAEKQSTLPHFARSGLYMVVWCYMKPSQLGIYNCT